MMINKMNYQLHYDNPEESLINRIFKIRNLQDNPDIFLDAKINDYRLDPFLLNDMEKAVDRIIKALKDNEKIMVFGDYDVDGITSSFVIYKFITKYLNYKNISIQYPDRSKDWYGLKKNHIDDIKDKWVDLIITVDNGIASLDEAIYARQKWLDLIITDHHQDLDSIPDAIAVVNPQISSDYPFKWLAGVGVTFKLICAILSKSKIDSKKRNQIFNYFLPIVAIWTISDVVPLVWENRALVKRWLELINSHHEHVPSCIKWFLKHLNLDNIDTFHIWFLIWPRINAWWRIKSPYDSLNSFLYSWETQIPYLQKLDEINNQRKKIQEDMFKLAESNIDTNKKFIFCAHESFHEWVIWIVSGRITEKYNKPSLVMKIDKDKDLGTASLRWPDYFNVIEMIKSAWDILDRFGWHRWAWWLGVKIKNIDRLKDIFEKYCDEKIADEDLTKSIFADTKIYPHEWENNILKDIDKLAPFGEWNQEPLFLVENISITKSEKVWNNWKSHLKIHGKIWDKKINCLFRGKWEDVEKLKQLEKIDVVGKVKKDNFNGGFYIDWVSWE